MTINELASGYLSFTGRPAATLSVSEYLEFVKLADGMSNVSSYQGRIMKDPVKEEPVVETILPDKKEDSKSFLPSSELNTAIPMVRDENPVSAITESSKLVNSNAKPKQASRRSALDLLKSVSG